MRIKSGFFYWVLKFLNRCVLKNSNLYAICSVPDYDDMSRTIIDLYSKEGKFICLLVN